MVPWHGTLLVRIVERPVCGNQTAQRGLLSLVKSLAFPSKNLFICILGRGFYRRLVLVTQVGKQSPGNNIIPLRIQERACLGFCSNIVIIASKPGVRGVRLPWTPRVSVYASLWKKK